jgi:hypothetical protein
VNLNTITEVRRAAGNGDEDFDWREGDSWLAGGTWLFSEPQPHLRRLLDLHGFGWEPLVVGERGLQISPTCTIARLDAIEAPPDWVAAPLIQQCCQAFQRTGRRDRRPLSRPPIHARPYLPPYLRASRSLMTEFRGRLEDRLCQRS